MELLHEVLVKVLENEEIRISFPQLKVEVKEIVELECYKALRSIKAILENEILSDFACIEKIVSVFECLGSNAGSRHDF